MQLTYVCICVQTGTNKKLTTDKLKTTVSELLWDERHETVSFRLWYAYGLLLICTDKDLNLG
jgi:hypothetical protein